jgi:putative nucleotidyltransferase with HDIG domain
MTIPSYDDCLALMEQAAMPAHIKRHSLAVTRVAQALVRALNQRGLQLDGALVSAAALLHDIAKANCLESKQDHAKEGAQVVTSWGYPRLAPLVRAHVGLWSYDSSHGLDEGLIVNYADKRVRHDSVVSLNIRFADLTERYATNDDARQALQQMLSAYRNLEAHIAQRLGATTKELDQLVSGTQKESGLQDPIKSEHR